MNQFLNDRYIDFSITEVVQTGDGYGFEIQLHYKVGSTVRPGKRRNPGRSMRKALEIIPTLLILI